MKRLSILSLLLLLLAGVSRAGVYSGGVFNATTSAAVVGQVVELRDSLTSLVMLDTTDANGGYSFTLPSLPAADDIYVRVYACGQTYTDVSTYLPSNPNHTHNFQICATTPAYKLQGNITLGGVANTGIADIYVIRKSYDSLTQSVVLTAIDTFASNSTGFYTRSYTSIPAGQLIAKAALRVGHPSYAGFLPTYYAPALNWSNANTLQPANFSSNNMTNINMTAGSNPGGPGFIGGLVSQGANKGNGVGDPLNKRLLLLTTSTGQAVGYTYSNANGQFSFSNLAFGSYYIFGDAWGKTNPMLAVTLSATQSSVSDITFEENSTAFKGHIGTLAVGNVSNTIGVNIFPNPATDFLQLSGMDAISGEKTVQLCSINGAVISAQTFAQGQSARISVAALPAGMYLLQVHTTAGNAQFKVVK